ncbi:Pleckstrin homology domain-containing family G member 1 [Camelus dromedarius]|uniref:Pleckstrin homology domain-containing family G member 1 n=1 Tax=Camelus dromedarius TaxID=9838 RepID=A0A5N4DX55_CAMDR|nr:Pleckstrin homology domain-containing family G member 1 [Camelus dromedarius]
MELSDSDRPISFGSTSSSASSRDSHGSFGSRMTLVSNSHLGLFPQDKDAGAIKLELIPARPFSSSELQRDSAAGPQNTDQAGDRQPRAQRRVEANAATKMGAESATSPKLLYVDRVVQEILETERTYVQDLKSIVEMCPRRGPEEPSAVTEVPDRNPQPGIPVLEPTSMELSDSDARSASAPRVLRLSGTAIWFLRQQDDP